MEHKDLIAGAQMLKEAREQANLTLKQASEKTGFSIEAIEAAEIGAVSLTVYAAWKFSTLYKMDLKKLCIAAGILIK